MCRPPMRGYVSSSLMTLTSPPLSLSPFFFLLFAPPPSLGLPTRRDTDWTTLGEQSTLTLARQWRSALTAAICFGWTDPSGRVPKRIRNAVDRRVSREECSAGEFPTNPYPTQTPKTSILDPLVRVAHWRIISPCQREREREGARDRIVELYRRANRSAPTHQLALARGGSSGDEIARSMDP